MTFPSDFTWGVATSSYQIEGSPLADGAGLSNWHRFALERGRIVNDDHGETACDHYRRSHDDVALIKELRAHPTLCHPAPPLHHWDLPATLEDHGGWLNRDTAYRFADFTEIMTRALDGQIQDWYTFNEPWVIMHEGYVNGAHPPGLHSAPSGSILALRLGDMPLCFDAEGNALDRRTS
jgi:beta-glucosidase